MIGGNIELSLFTPIAISDMLKEQRCFSGSPAADNSDQTVVPIDFILEKTTPRPRNGPEQTALNAEKFC